VRATANQRRERLKTKPKEDTRPENGSNCKVVEHKVGVGGLIYQAKGAVGWEQGEQKGKSNF